MAVGRRHRAGSIESLYGERLRASPPPIEPQTAHFQGFTILMYENARWLAGEELYAAAVMVAQAAVEMGARRAFVSMLVDRYGSLTDELELQLLPASLSFLQDECRALWTELTGCKVSRPRDPPVWPEYEKHVQYRNRIAHGDMWGDAWGWESVRAAGWFIMRLDEHMGIYQAAHPDP